MSRIGASPSAGKVVKPAWAGFLLSLSLCLDLGVVNVAILQAVLRQGGTAGFLIGLGSGFGDLIYFTLAIVGASAVFENVLLRRVLWLCGTAVLLFLAGRMAREAVHGRKLNFADAPPQPKAPAALFAIGVGLALASPSAILWFAAVGGSVIASFGGARGSLWPFTTGFFVGGVAWSATFAYAIARAKNLLGTRLVQALALASALVFLYFAAVVFLRGLREVF
jgi:L-lysine exporter family protein LysE/ArgO